MFLIIVRRISVILLVGLSLLFSVQNLLPLARAAARNPQLAAQNEVSVWENRFDTVRRALPPGVEHVGYVAEWDLPGVQPSADQDNEFRMSRYVMAPVILARGVDSSWTIGNFSTNKKFKDWLSENGGSYEIQEFSGGIYLLHKVQK